MEILWAARYLHADAFVLVCDGLRIVGFVRYLHNDAIGVVCIGMGILCGWRYSRTAVLCSVCVGLGIVGIAWYSRAYACGTVCDGLGIVGFVRYPRTDALHVRAYARGPVAVWTMGPLAEVCAPCAYLLRAFLNSSEDASARAVGPGSKPTKPASGQPAPVGSRPLRLAPTCS